MSDWTAGYVAEIDYTYGYYPELNPLRAKLTLLNSAVAIPKIGTACELGFGQGLSVNLHAAASNINWYGTDFNPSQAGFANALNEVSGADAKLYEEAFADFTARPDLPEFDFIGLHGIWSWISDGNRAVITEFIKRKLRVGGILYISYNTLPGWATFAPMRHLMTQYAETLSARGQSITNRIDDSLQFAEKLIATRPVFMRDGASVADRLTKLKEHNRQYLAHEYFNRDWYPTYFSTIAEQLTSAKLQFVGSTNFIDKIDSINLTAEQQNLLNEIPDPIFRESVRDFMVNQQFRRDYWIKGIRKLTNLEQLEELRTQSVILANLRENLSLKVKGIQGEADMKEEIYMPIIDSLSDHKIKTIGQIEQVVSNKNITFAQLLQAIMFLTSNNFLSATQLEGQISKSKKQTEKLNTYLMNRARSSGDIVYLASPVTGGGVNVDRFQQLFLLAIAQKVKEPDEIAKRVWQVVASQGHKLIKEGKTLETPEENLTELINQVKSFVEKRLPLLKALQIA